MFDFSWWFGYELLGLEKIREEGETHVRFRLSRRRHSMRLASEKKKKKKGTVSEILNLTIISYYTHPLKIRTARSSLRAISALKRALSVSTRKPARRPKDHDK